MERLKGKNAVIIGGGQRKGEGIGNGRAISIRFAEEGANVTVVARHMESAEGTIDRIGKEYRESCHPDVCDISKEDEVRDLFERIGERIGNIDVLVNNVGVFAKESTFFELDMESHRKSMDVNVNGAMYCFKYVVPLMKSGGSIIQVSSIGGSIVAAHEFFSYAMSKHMMSYLGENMAATLAPKGIRVNNIILGVVNTPMAIEPLVENGANRKDVVQRRDDAVPLLGGAGTAWDTANAALFLASDESRFITGASLQVDGGALVTNGRC